MNEYILRWITAGILLGVIAIGLQYEASSIIIASLVMVLGLIEYKDIHSKILDNFYPKLLLVNPRLAKFSSIPQCLFLLYFTYLTDCDILVLLPVLTIILILTLVIRIYQASSIIGRLDKNENAFLILNWGLTSLMLEFTAIFLFGFSFWLYALLYRQAPAMIFVGLCLVFQTDHGALVIGKKFGKHSINQFFDNKTYEGVFGGFLFSFVSAILMKFEAAVLIRLLFPNWISFNDYAIIGFWVPLLSIIGDLFESFLKKWAKVKNSGTLLPGHGGLFDRIDSVLMAAPFLYFYNLLILSN